MVAFEWKTDVLAPISIAVIGTMIAVFFARRAAIRTAKDQRGLALELARLQRELAALDRIDTAILSLRDEISNLLTLLGDETAAAAAGTQPVDEAFRNVTRTVESLYVRVRPDLRSVIVPFARAWEWLGQLRTSAEMLDIVREETTPDDPGRTKALNDARSTARELLERVNKMREDLLEAVDLYVTRSTEPGKRSLRAVLVGMLREGGR
jgi:hypothetical protein